LPPEGWLEDVSRNEADGGAEIKVLERLARSPQALPVQVEDGQAPPSPYPLAQALDPERGGTASVEDVEATEVAEEVELAIAEGDKVLFELSALLRCQ